MQPVFIHKVERVYTGPFISVENVTYTVADKLSKQYVWQKLSTHDSVHVLVDNISTKELLFVKQIRIPVLVNSPDTSGEVIECCAGIIDGHKEAFEEHRAVLTARDEISEELGYTISTNAIKPVKVLKASVGTAGSTAHTFMAQVNCEQYTGQRLTASEDIEVIHVPYAIVEDFLKETVTDATTMYLATLWLKENEG